MTITDLDVFCSNLNQLIRGKHLEMIRGKHLEMIRGNQLIKAHMREIILLYNNLNYINNNLNTYEKRFYCAVEDVENWKRRLTDGAHEAEKAVDMFLSSAILKARHEIFSGQGQSNVVDCSLNLMDIIEDLKSIRHEMLNKTWERVKSINIQNLVEPQSARPQLAETWSWKTTARVNPSATGHEQVIVGFDDDALSIMERLAGDRKQLDIISIVGMGGLGKTTLATKIYNDQYVAYYFDIRAWITVSEAYATRDLLIGILISIGKSVHEAITEQKLCEMVYKSLKGRKYLIVIDDIWSTKAWDDLRLVFPDDNTGSRILLTTRLTEIAWHARPGGFTHNLQCLTEEKSWELLCKKTFRGYECPESLIGIGKHIAKKCYGLPLALVVIAGILEKGEKSKDLWEKVAESVSSYIVDDPKACLNTLALSYDHLPQHLRNCFLYVGGFPEDYEIQARRLIRLWMAEGFVKGKKHAQKSLEEQGEDYLIDLVDRNLLIVVNRRSDGGIKSCRLHDLLRELCLKKAAEEKLFKKIVMSDSNSTSIIKNQHRVFTDYTVLCDIYSHDSNSPTYMRSVLCFSNSEEQKNIGRRWVPSFLLVRVLDLLNIRIFDFQDIEILIHLRYLAVWSGYREFSFSEANLLKLQTLILKGKYRNSMYSMYNLQDMSNLRHLSSERIISVGTVKSFPFLRNLQTISRLKLDHEAPIVLQSLPNIKKLACSVSATLRHHAFVDFDLLTHLEALNVENYMDEALTIVNPIRLPETLKKLTLKGLCLPWSHMSTIQRLPNLEVLKLLDSSFKGSLWDTGDEQFCQLKFLKLQNLDIELWGISSYNFPHLRKLEVRSCKNLKQIPLKIGDICTLDHIEIDDSNSLVVESVNKIQEEQRAMGNYDLHVKLVDIAPLESFFQGDPFYE